MPQKDTFSNGVKLLVLTQAVDSEDTYLGFFVGWINALSARFETIQVVCLKRGEARLSANVRVHSLGKEVSQSRFTYLVRFYRYAWTLRHEYDAVFVHMNQEYVLLGALLWKMLGKKVYLWRNHGAGNFLTTLAAALADTTFCTSKFSYVARSKKNVLMPVGIDTDAFHPVAGVDRKPRSILFFGRFAPSKQPALLVQALAQLTGEWSASFVGSPLPKDSAYESDVRRRVHELNLEDRIEFLAGIPHREAPRMFSAYDIYVNLAASGMYDKTIFEAAACGCRVLAASRDFAALSPESAIDTDSAAGLTEKLAQLLRAAEDERTRHVSAMQEITESHSLHTLVERLAHEIS